MIARAVNASFGDWENLFAPGSFNCVKLLDGDAIARKAAYTLLNVTEAGLVRLPEYWDGVISWSMKYGEGECIPKPSVFFGDKKPKETELVLVRPKALFPGCDDQVARTRLLSEVRRQAHEIAKRIQEEGGGFVGMRRVLRQPRHSAPHTRAPRRGIAPTVASRNKWARIEALQMREGFRDKYEAARVAWQAGIRTVVFPLGTYLLRERYGVRVAEK